MPQIDMPTEQKQTDHQKHEAELRDFMAQASKTAVELSPLLTREIEERKLESGQALIAILLYAANYARKAGASLRDFVGSAEQAYGDAEELFASGVTDVLKAARALLVRGWCQGELATKLVKDATHPDGKRRVGCHIKDTYASRWSLLGAVDASADADSNRVKAREALVLAIRDAGGQFPPGSLTVTVITDFNDHGYVPPLPPEVPLPENASDELKAQRKAQRAELEAQWPKPVADPVTKERVLAVLDRAIAICGG